ALVAPHRPHARPGGGHRAPRLRARQGRPARARPVDILGEARNLLRLRRLPVKRTFLLFLASMFAGAAFAADPPLIRLGRGFAAEEQVWLMSARPDLAPNQGKSYQLKQILFQANPERFQAFLAGELDAGTAPGLAVIFARAEGVDMKIVANICQEAKGYFSTTYMVKDDGPVKRVQDLKDRTIGVVGYK